MKRIEQMSLWERAYLPEILRGLSVTGYHCWRNLSIHVLHVFGLAKTRQADVTVQYPEERTPYPDTFRGRHRLTLGADDTANCTACFLCATACPADCIYIEAKEYPDPLVEKQAKRFDIDMLRCVFCGMCVEACPEEAIIMSRETEICEYTREGTVWGIDRLMRRSELPEFGLGFRPNEKLVESTLAFVPKEKTPKKMPGRITLKEDVEMIPHVTFEPAKD